ncbi:MAG: glycoside hydrolase [Verrucomicrobia bacterium]|nr:glycoside hydrolase [Verrucomicrobiota bacterium]
MLKINSFTGRGEFPLLADDIVDIEAVYEENEWFISLLRSNSAESDDYFKAFIIPALAVNPEANPTRRDDLYVVYADKGENTGDRADSFLVYSKDGGATWEPKQRVSTVWANDQWMPIVTVRPNGNQLFIAWCDRRGDVAQNSLIDLYGRFGTIATDGTVTLAPADFRITTTSFPPAFPGALSENTQQWHHDPVWPPGYPSAPEWVNLHWRYPWFPPRNLNHPRLGPQATTRRGIPTPMNTGNTTDSMRI